MESFLKLDYIFYDVFSSRFYSFLSPNIKALPRLAPVRGSSHSLFRLKDGTRTKHLDGTFEQCLKESGLMHDRHDKKRTLYSMRHTYATFQILNGIDLHTLAVQMHTSIAMLETHYSHLTPTLKAKELAGRQSVKKILQNN